MTARFNSLPPRAVTGLCLECGGWGFIHCCEGDQEQPECQLQLPKPDNEKEIIEKEEAKD